MKAISLLFLVIACASNPQVDQAKEIALPLIGKHPGIRECYTSTTHYIQNPEAEALLKVEFEVQKDGTTTEHKMLASSVPDQKFKTCVIESLKSLMYPPQKEVFIVEQSFTLRPGKK